MRDSTARWNWRANGWSTERGERASCRRSRYRPDELSHRSGILLIDLQGRDLHIDQRGLDLRMPISCMRAGRLTPARTMSEAKVCRNRCGLAF